MSLRLHGKKGGQNVARGGGRGRGAGGGGEGEGGGAVPGTS
jgi:hypothetical protein